jgi:hypothetical protein
LNGIEVIIFPLTLPKGISGGEEVNYWHGTDEKTGKKGVLNGLWKEPILLADLEKAAVVFLTLRLTT